MSQPNPAPTLVSMEARQPAPMHELASAGQRLGAVVLDAFVGGIPIIIPIIGWAWAIVYACTKDALPFFGGQSLGKKILGIRVIDARTGKPIKGEFGTAIIRQLSLMIPLFGLVDACMVFSAEHQRFGDKWAHTVVVKNTESLDAQAGA
jgi:uncharacterized RDD family membrane protein YckC